MKREGAYEMLRENECKKYKYTYQKYEIYNPILLPPPKFQILQWRERGGYKMLRVYISYSILGLGKTQILNSKY